VNEEEPVCVFGGNRGPHGADLIDRVDKSGV